MTDPVQAAIDAAKASAQNHAPAKEDIVMVPATQQNTAGVTSYMPAQAATLDMVANAGMNVDAWLKAKGEGFKIDAKPGMTTTVLVAMSLQDIMPFYGIRFGNPATYLKSFDRATCVQGGTWAEALQRAKAADPKFTGDYTGTDLRMKVLEDVKTEAGVVLLEAGKLLGHGTSPTGTKPVGALIREVRNRKIPDDQVMKIKVTHAQRTKPGVEPWGVLEFEIIEEDYIDDSLAGE